ncbi:MAG: hypothetical protein B7Z32_07185 [Hydrogenophilales bacterium 12-64-13]|nr:MAG: hypothetical protein B7Z32_07185 [Hydrogenophilales bacterium 12-64-13]
MNLTSRIRASLASLLLALGTAVVSPAAQALDIAETPLFLTVSVAPNVIITLDDSGSMARAYTPDLCGGTGYSCDKLDDNRWTKAGRANPIYYNPAITYEAPLQADGTPLTTSFNAAYRNGFDSDWGSPVDLATGYRPTAFFDFPSGGPSESYMEHYAGETALVKADTPTHTDTGTTTNVNAPTFVITDFENYDGSVSGSNPGTNLISVKVNGTTASRVGNFSGSCTSSNDPANNNQYKTLISGSTLTLCFRNSDSMKNKSVEVIHKKSGGVASTTPAGRNDPTTAYYYVFDSSNTNCDGSNEDNDCYDPVIVSATSGPGGTDERQNFANWYSFYRTRNLATMASASLAFYTFDPRTRIAWQALNSCRGSSTSLVTTDCEGWETTTTNFSNAIKPFTGTHKENFYKWLFRQKTNDSTPLKAATMRAGGYFSTEGENSPYDDDLDTSGSVGGGAGQLSCRKNFHILMTDGVWNESTTVSSTVGEADNDLDDPYQGVTSSTLADVAYHYWANDLVSTLDNNLTPYIPAAGATPEIEYANPRNDPATHQHMVNFTVGLGLGSFLTATGLTWEGDTYSGSYLDISGGDLDWPVPANNTNTNVSDLWHAAINSRGQFFSADDPQALVDAFRNVRDAIEDAEPSAAALAANSTSIEGGAYVYQATFTSRDWSGNLKAFFVDSFGNVSASSTWESADKLPAAASRYIFTFNGSTGTSFDWGNLTPAQQALLNTDITGATDALGEARLAWLRGVQTQEESAGGPFRNRTALLGDIINSDPAYAHQDDFGHASMSVSEASSYASYVSSKSTRPPVVFVGANDGMLHAFKADNECTEEVLGDADTDSKCLAVDDSAGTELFAFVPNAVYPNLSKLTSPDYAHKYYVDAGPTVGDAYIAGDWKTVLVGGLGGGGQSVYALDVSAPSAPSASMVMWEYTDADLGLTYSKPQIVRLNDDSWAAVFGNGFNSSTGQAYFYVIDIGTGALIKKIAVGPGILANGLSTPALVDTTGDKVVDYAYVGDLQGNLWKIDLSSSNTADWDVAYSGTALFTARNASGEVQPIHAQPVVGPDSDESTSTGAMVYFGTGQYLQSDDVTDGTVQSFYGIWDKGAAITTTNRSELQQQSIEDTLSAFGEELRQTSNASVDWTVKLGWYMDFSTASGERIVSQALLRHDRVIFLTLIPSTSVCEPGGESWLMELDALTGSRTLVSSFDFSGEDGSSDGSFDGSDLLASGATASGIKTSVGISRTATWFTGKNGKDLKVLTGTTGGIQSIDNKGGESDDDPTDGTFRRTYWLQIQ